MTVIGAGIPSQSLIMFISFIGRIGKGKQKWHYLETYEKVLIVAKPKK
jgi:hypothetical protein